jgi:hypothetical protein
LAAGHQRKHKLRDTMIAGIALAYHAARRTLQHGAL